ncbi:MAG: hypothetical protein ACTSVY_04705 [Candidatus Helarchaeota archaeon]
MFHYGYGSYDVYGLGAYIIINGNGPLCVAFWILLILGSVLLVTGIILKKSIE